MSAKPTTTPVQWDANDTNITTPTSGQQSGGSATNAILASGVWNYLMRWLTAWTIYLADGIIQHSAKTLNIPASAGETDNAGWIFVAAGVVLGSWEVGAASKSVMIPISLDVGERITAVHAYVRDTSAGAAITMSLWKTIDNTNSVQIGSNQTSAASGASQTLSLTGLTQTVASKEWYSVRLMNAASGSMLDNQIRGIDVVYDRVTS